MLTNSKLIANGTKKLVDVSNIDFVEIHNAQNLGNPAVEWILSRTYAAFQCTSLPYKHSLTHSLYYCQALFTTTATTSTIWKLDFSRPRVLHLFCLNFLHLKKLFIISHFIHLTERYLAVSFATRLEYNKQLSVNQKVNNQLGEKNS